MNVNPVARFRMLFIILQKKKKEKSEDFPFVMNINFRKDNPNIRLLKQTRSHTYPAAQPLYTVCKVLQDL